MTRPQERQNILTQARNLKMARSAHAYVRGSTVKFYEWLDSSRRCQFPDGPPVWICGDCHVGNLGPLADAKGRVLIQIRDLDQTVIGNPAHDLIRLGLSLASASRGSDLPGVTTAKILEELVAGYQSALSGSFETDRDKSYRPIRRARNVSRRVSPAGHGHADKTLRPRRPWRQSSRHDRAIEKRRALFTIRAHWESMIGCAGTGASFFGPMNQISASVVITLCAKPT